MKTRMFYLDALRSAAMLFGLLVHAGTLQSDSALSQSIFFASEQFRMATFFVISGFFATMVLDRRGWRAFWQHRAMGLIIPLVTALLVLNPVAWWLAYIYNSGAEGIPVGFVAFLAGERPFPARPINWHLHLWFLFTLIAYVVALPGFRPLLDTRAVLGTIQRLAGLQKDVMALSVAALMIGGEIAGRAVFALVFEPVVSGTPVSWLVRASLQYFPYFVLGALCFVSSPLFEALHRISWVTFAVALALRSAEQAVGASGELGTILDVLAEEVMAVAVIMALLTLFRQVLNHDSLIVRRVNEAVYTIYLFHYLVIYTLGTFVLPRDWPFELRFVLAVVITFAFTYVLHHAVITRVPVLRLLLNGKTKLAGQKLRAARSEQAR